MKALIVDDETYARKRISKLLKEREEIAEIQECRNGEETIVKIEKYQPDLLFLDVDLKDMSGFDVISELKGQKLPLIIFVTAYEAYAVKAFDNNAADFLLKPFKEDRFHQSLDRIKRLKPRQLEKQFGQDLENFLELKNIKSEPSRLKKLPIKLGNKTILIKVEDIKYVCAAGYYAEIFTEENKYVMRQSLSNLIEVLDPAKFCRIHRSTIINIEFIHEIVHSDYSEIDVRMKDNKLIRVSKSHKKEFLDRLGI
ncbi:LytTR family DNA-binding domain-containing protein [Zunongwangia sp. F363]|uniref:LytTR family DNA-binding domain-containing protein n=1 Tax=Autumnicola tepida TaxID=3075595 RepID=A0ABU3CBR1_9FLAO|nr:LytTR family DNA-binding domain-containing protein [Zunongwangia sp. F363]MDT0643764.1 LytTR family DNA-binding domain-containing protein [Zunongwangia sp. F363]